MLKVLIACEESQRVCQAFRDRGHEAYSCDIIAPSGGHPEWHIKGDCTPLVNGHCSFDTMDGVRHTVDKWDLLIAHPPCTYISNAGARWLYAGHKLNQERYEKGKAAAEFLMSFLNSDVEHVAVENPQPSAVFGIRKYEQIIQPYEYGHEWSKKTCLWLKNLPLLQPTKIIADHRPYCSSGSYSIFHDPKYAGASRRGGAAKSRSKTFKGIAEAMADQWSRYVMSEKGEA